MKSSSIASSSAPGGDVSAARGSARVYLWIVLGSASIALAVVELLLRVYVVPIENFRPLRIHQVYTVENPDVVLGDSRLYRAFLDAEGFTNLATGGGTPSEMLEMAREYFRFQEAGRVVVAASPQLFTAQAQRQGMRDRGWFGQNIGLPFALYVFEPGIARHVGLLMDLPDLERRRLRAYQESRVGNSIERERQRRRARRSPEEIRSDAVRSLEAAMPVPALRDSPVFEDYRELLELLRAADAEVCMLRAPVTPAFDRVIREHEVALEAMALLRETARELGFRYVDSTRIPVLLEGRHFLNEDHLGPEGAAVFAPAAIEACFGPGPAGGEEGDPRQGPGLPPSAAREAYGFVGRASPASPSISRNTRFRTLPVGLRGISSR